MISGMVFGFLKWFLFSNLLEPFEFGVYTTIITSITFISYFGVFGLNELLIKKGALMAGKGKITLMFKLRDNLLIIVFFNSIFLIFIFLCVIILISDFNLNSSELVLICLILLLTSFFNIIDAGYRASLRTISFAVMVFVRSTLLLFIGYLLVNSYGLKGLLISEFLAIIFSLFFAFFVAGPYPRVFDLDKKIFKKYLRVGFIFLILNVFRYFSFTSDKWILGFFLDQSKVGVYSFLMITFLALTAFAGVYNAVVIPNLISNFGKTSSLKDLFGKTSSIVSKFIAVSLIITPFYLIVFNLVTKMYFEKYYIDDFIFSLLAVYLGSVFHISSQFFDSFFYSVNKQFFLFLISGISLIVFLILYIFTGFYFPNLFYFSIAFCFSKFFLFVLTLLKINKTLKYNLNLKQSSYGI